jgi:hypothetical protein
MKGTALKQYFSYTNIDVATIPKDLCKTHVEKAYIFAVNRVTSF